MVNNTIMPASKKRIIPKKTIKKKTPKKTVRKFSPKQIKNKLISDYRVVNKFSIRLEGKLNKIVYRNLRTEKIPPTKKEIIEINKGIKKMNSLCNALTVNAVNHKQVLNKGIFKSLMHELWHEITRVTLAYDRVKSDFPESGLIKTDSLELGKTKSRELHGEYKH